MYVCMYIYIQNKKRAQETEPVVHTPENPIKTLPGSYNGYTKCFLNAELEDSSVGKMLARQTSGYEFGSPVLT